MNSIKRLREKLGLTQDALAIKLDIARTTVTMWETGKAMPMANTLPKIAEALECSINDLFEEIEEREEGA